MARKQGEEPSVEDYEFYLAEDMADLDVEVDPDDATPTRPPSRELQRRIAASEAKRAPKKAPKLAERGRAPKMMTAQEALAVATRAEAEREEAKKRQAEQKRKAELAKRLAKEAALKAEARKLQEEADEEREAAEWARAAFGSSGGPGRAVVGATPMQAPPRSGAGGALTDLVDDVEILQVYTDIPAAVVGPLFQSHQVRAQHDGDLAGVVAFAAVGAAYGGRRKA